MAVEKRIASIGIAGAMTIAAIGLIGYVSGLRLLGSIKAEYIPMAPSTAICFILLGSVILLAVGKARQVFRRASIVITGMISLYGFIKAAEYIMGFEVSFEELIVTPIVKLGEAPVGIMSPYTGALFFIAGLAAMAQVGARTGKAHERFLGNAAGILGLTVLTASFVFAYSYFLGTPILYGIGRLVPMAFTTAMSFLLLSIGQICANGRDHFPVKLFSGPSYTAVLMRVFVPVVVFSIISFDMLKTASERMTAVGPNPTAEASFLALFAVVVSVICGYVGNALAVAYEKSMEQRRQLEKQLAELANRQYAALVENLHQKVFLKDRNSVYISCNRSYARDFGMSPAEIQGKTDYDLFPARLAEKYIKDDKRIMESGQTENIEEEYAVTKDFYQGARTVTVNTIKVPISKADGQTFGILGIFWDISERKQAENARLKSEEQFRAVFENATDGIMLADPVSRRLLSANRELCRMIGYSPAEIAGLKVTDIHPRENIKYVLNEFDKHARMGARSSSEIPVRRKDGSVFYADITSSNVTIGGEHILLGFFHDCTERRKAEEARAKAIEEIRDLYENAPCGYHSLDKDGVFVHMNETELSWLGYSRDEFIGKKKISDVLTPQGALIFDKEFPAFKKRGWVKGLDVELVRKDGSVFPVTISAVAVRDDNGEYLFSRSISFDMTERKKVEEDKRRAQEDKIAMEIKSKFISMVSHELRSPLSSIKEGINIVLDGLVGDISAEQKDLLEVAKRNVERLHRLVNNVLDFQKISSGKMSYDFRENDINDLVSEIAISLRLSAGKKGIGLKLDLDEGLPDRILFDRDRITQVLTNLTGNAVKFTEKGIITIITKREDNRVCITVQDTGIGIRADEMGSLFKGFEQLGSTKAKVKGGTGLGLAISKDIVTSHKGRIWAESEEGKGSSFHFTLPIENTGNSHG